MLLPTLLATLHLGQLATPTNWLLEVESRDSPILLRLELKDNDAKVLRQTKLEHGAVAKTGKDTITITFKNNLLIGGGEMKLKLSDGKAEGSLKTTLYKENISGRLAPVTSSKSCSEPAVNGPGFKGLDIPSKLSAAKTAGVSLARIEDDQVVEVGFYGVTDAATREPVTGKTMFQAGGMGSVLTCLAALKLAGQGRLDLNATVTSVIPQIHLGIKDGKEVQILDLLRGSSGLDQYKFRGYSQSQDPPALLQLLSGADPEQLEPLSIKYPIGVQSGFKGINHAVLQAVLEKKTGKPFDALMRDLILNPLGMDNSTFELRPKPRKGISFATGHYESGEPLLFGNHIYPMLGDSGLWTTAPDLAKAFIEGGRLISGRSNQILAPEKLNLLALVDGPQGVAGFVRGDSDTYFHGGDTYGQFSNFAIHPQKRSGVIVMTNRVMNWRLVNQLIEMVSNKSIN